MSYYGIILLLLSNYHVHIIEIMAGIDLDQNDQVNFKIYLLTHLMKIYFREYFYFYYSLLNRNMCMILLCTMIRRWIIRNS